MDNEHAVVPDLESYVALRQDSAGIKMLFDLIEYAEGLRIPDKEYSLPVLRQLRHGACNIVAWLTVSATYVRRCENMKATLIARVGYCLVRI